MTLELSITLDNIRTIKKWDHVPFFVTFAHHFDNHLCGHSRSLFELVGKKTNQLQNLNEPFSDMGISVVKELLSKENSKRILIDIKHMSARSRREYINMVMDSHEEYKNEEIPIIISHGTNTTYCRIIR